MTTHFRPALLSALSVAFGLSGCTALGPMATWEVLKWSGSTALAHQGAKPVNTVHHGDAPVRALCIEYNRNAPMEDLVPAMQAELRGQGVESRVYDAGTGPRACTYWLRYVGSVEWGSPPLSEAPRPYLSAAALSLHNADGRLLSSSAYVSETSGARWASTRKKIAPVVKALITGFET